MVLSLCIHAYLWVLHHVAFQLSLVFWVPQIINEDIAKKTCEEHQLCVVAVLPHILDTGTMSWNSLALSCSVLPALRTLSKWINDTDAFIFTFKSFSLFKSGAAGRNSYLEVLLKLADKYKKKMWG